MRYFLIHAAVISIALGAAAYGRGGHDHDRGDGGTGHDSNAHETWDAGNHQTWCDVNPNCNGAGAYFTYGSQHPGFTSQVSLADFESRWRGRYGDNGPTTRTQPVPSAPAALPRGSATFQPHYAAVRVPSAKPVRTAARPRAPLDLLSMVVAEVTR